MKISNQIRTKKNNLSRLDNTMAIVVIISMYYENLFS